MNKKVAYSYKNYKALLCNDDAVLIIKVRHYLHEPFFLEMYLMQREGLHYWAIYNLPDEMYDDKFKKLFNTYPDMAKHIYSVETIEKGLLIKHEFGETLLLRKAEN